MLQDQDQTEDPSSDFNVGDLVMRHAHKHDNKLAPQWLVPFTLREVHAKSAVLKTIQGDPVPRRHHFSHLRRFNLAARIDDGPESTMEDGVTATEETVG